MNKNRKPDFSDKVPFSRENNFDSVVLENELTGALPVISDEALEIYEQVYHEFYGMPINPDDDYR